MKSKTLVSVVIPVYNGEKYLVGCIKNILSQSYKNLEVIVVDDGSADRSAEIARLFPVILIQHEVNRGLSAARNSGIDHAKGEFIHFMDVDDAINPDYYQEMVEAIMETGADVALGGMVNERTSSKTQIFKKREVYTDIQDKLTKSYVGKWGYVWRYLFCLDYIRQFEFRFEEGRFIEDLLFSLPAIYHANKLVVVPDAIYFYYDRENSIMNCKDKAHVQKKRQDWLYVKDFREEFSLKNNIKIPGVNSGKVAYVIRKIIASFKHRNIKMPN